MSLRDKSRGDARIENRQSAVVGRTIEVPLGADERQVIERLSHARRRWAAQCAGLALAFIAVCAVLLLAIVFSRGGDRNSGTTLVASLFLIPTFVSASFAIGFWLEAGQTRLALEQPTYLRY